MKTVIMILVVLIAIPVFGDEKSQVTVKSVEKTNGVVLITLAEKGKSLELQCNDGASFCTAVKAGEYEMVRLPKNRGLYDCQNVELYKPGAETTPEQRLGQYCLVTN